MRLLLFIIIIASTTNCGNTIFVGSNDDDLETPIDPTNGRTDADDSVYIYPLADGSRLTIAKKIVAKQEQVHFSGNTKITGLDEFLAKESVKLTIPGIIGAKPAGSDERWGKRSKTVAYYRVTIDDPSNFTDSYANFLLSAKVIPSNLSPATTIVASAIPSDALPFSAIPPNALPSSALPPQIFANPTLALPSSGLSSSTIPQEETMYFLNKDISLDRKNATSDEEDKAVLQAIAFYKTPGYSLMKSTCNPIGDLSRMTGDGMPVTCLIDAKFESIEIHLIVFICTKADYFSGNLDGEPIALFKNKLDLRNEINDRPTLKIAESLSLTVEKETRVAVLADDPDPDLLRFEVKKLPSFARTETYHLVFTPQQSDLGKTFDLPVRVWDNGNPYAETTKTLSIRVVEDNSIPPKVQLTMVDIGGYLNIRKPNLTIESNIPLMEMRFDLSEEALQRSGWRSFSQNFEDLDLGEDGPKTIYAEFIAQNGSSVLIETQVILDTLRPELSFSSTPLALSPSYDARFSITASEENLALVCLLDEQPLDSCNLTVELHNLTPGEHTYRISAIDKAGNESAPLDYTFEVTALELATILESGPASLSNTPQAIFTFSADNAASFHCQLDQQTEQQCKSPWTIDNLPDGIHLVSITAIDGAGAREKNPLKGSFTIDTTPPTSGTITITDNQGFTNIASPPLTISSSDSSGVDKMRIATSENGLAAATWLVYATTALAPDLSLGGEGVKTIFIEFIDKAQNIQKNHSSDLTIYDITAPVTSLDFSPPVLTTSQAADFIFSSEPGASFSCQIDNSSYTNCSSPLNYDNLGAGLHFLLIRSRDITGNQEQLPLEFSWTVDTEAPSTGAMLINDNNGYTNEKFPLLAISTTGAAKMRFALVESDLAQATWVPYSSRYQGIDIAPDNSQGIKTIFVEFKDSADNTQQIHASAMTTFDTVQPNTAVVSSPSGLVNNTLIVITFSGEQGATFECRFDGQSFAPCVSPASQNQTIDGPHTFQVRSRDPAGNIEDPPKIASWIFDGNPPGMGSILINLGSAATNDPQLDLDIYTTEASKMRLALSEADLAWTVWQNFAAKTIFDLGDEPEGTITIWVEFRDDAGNIQTNHPSASIYYDLTPPVTTITDKPLPITVSTNATFAFLANEQGCTFYCEIDSDTPIPCLSPKTFSGLSSGLHIFTVWAVDPAGNNEQPTQQYQWTVDLIAPDQIGIDTKGVLRTIVPDLFVHISIHDNVSPTAYILREDSAVPGPNDPDWIAISGGQTISFERSFVLSNGYAIKTLHLHAKDRGNNISTGVSTSVEFIDPMPDNNWVGIPGTNIFRMGAQNTASDGFNFDPDPGDDAGPVHSNILSAFYILAKEVSAEGYLRCMDSGLCSPPSPGIYETIFEKPDHPINYVSFEQASTYCNAIAGDLPTETQWEYAARGHDGRNLPYMIEIPQFIDDARMNCLETSCNDGYEFTAPIGAFPEEKSYFGLEQISGNVAEWVRDNYDQTVYARKDPATPDYWFEDPLNSLRVVRGGSFNSALLSDLKTHTRTALDQDSQEGDLGFRCVEDIAVTDHIPPQILELTINDGDVTTDQADIQVYFDLTDDLELGGYCIQEQLIDTYVRPMPVLPLLDDPCWISIPSGNTSFSDTITSPIGGSAPNDISISIWALDRSGNASMEMSVGISLVQ